MAEHLELPELPQSRPSPTPRVEPARTTGRPLDDGTTEVLRVIEFLWIGREGVQPVLMLQRELLH